MRKALFLLILLLLLTSCLKSTVDTGDERKEKEEYPDLQMKEATFTIGTGDGSPILLEGDSITFYSKESYAELEGFSFYQTDEEGNVTLSGHADKGYVDIDRNIIEFVGNVSFSKESDGMGLKAEGLRYDADNNEITAEGRVVVESSEGVFEGEGFQGDLAYSSYTFERIEKGELKNE